MIGDFVRGVLVDVGLRDDARSRSAPAYRQYRDRVREYLLADPRRYARAKAVARGARAATREARFRSWKLWSQIRFGPMRTIQVYDGRSLTVRTDDYRGFAIWNRGGSQKHLVETFRRLAEQRPDVLIDVGANYGEFTCAVADLGIPVIAVEANPALVECLRTTFAGRSNVTVVHAAATEREGEVRFFVHPESSGASSLSSWWAPPIFTKATSPSDLREVIVPGRTLDGLVLEVLGRAPRTIAMKIDVEGHELEVVRGARNLLAGATGWRVLLEHAAELFPTLEDAESCWQEWARYPGVVLPDQGALDLPSATEFASAHLGASREACNLLIGRGSLGPAS